jgi:hypothetical protein
VPGWERFLLPPGVSDLIGQARYGPIALINISEYRCDALVLTSNGVRIVRLDKLTPERVAEQVEAFLDAVDTIDSRKCAARQINGFFKSSLIRIRRSALESSGGELCQYFGPGSR